MQDHLQSHRATAAGPEHGTVLAGQQLFLSKVLELVESQAHNHEAEMDALRSRIFTLEAKVEAVPSRIGDRGYEALPILSHRATEASAQESLRSWRMPSCEDSFDSSCGTNKTEEHLLVKKKGAAQVQIQKLDEKLAKFSQDLTNFMSNQQGQKPNDVQLDSFGGGEAKMNQSVRTPVESIRTIKAIKSSERAYVRDVQSYRRLEDSVWEGVFFIGISNLTTIRGQILLVCGLAVNLLLQMSAVYLVSQHMIVNPYDDAVLDELRRWKDCENNTEQQLALNTACKDIHLDVQTIWTDVNDFFTKDLPYPAGWVMSIIATMMWVSIMAVEFRDILTSTLSIWSIPKGVGTFILESNNRYTLFEVHGTRKWAMLVVAVARFIIAVNLLHSGTLFLTYTSDIESLIMNAVALAFVIDVDKVTFHMFAPSSVTHVIGNLEPLPIGDPVRQDTKVWILLLLIFAYIAVIDIVFLRPFVHSMEDVIKIINW